MKSVYFSHDSNARNDPKIKALRRNYGLIGYAAYWIIVEMLREATDYKLPYKYYIFEAIAEEINDDSVDTEQVEKMINDFIKKFELLHSDGEFFWSDSLLRRMDIKDQAHQTKSESGRLGGIKSGATRSSTKQNEAPLQKNEANEAKEKEKINIKENKDLKNRYVFLTPTYEEVSAYCQERNNKVDPQQFIDHYTSNGWMVGKNKMKDWRASVRTWERRTSESVGTPLRGPTSPPGSNLDYLRRKIEEANNRDGPGNHEINLHDDGCISVEARVI